MQKSEKSSFWVRKGCKTGSAEASGHRNHEESIFVVGSLLRRSPNNGRRGDRSFCRPDLGGCEGMSGDRVFTIRSYHNLASAEVQHNCKPGARLRHRSGVTAARNSSFNSRHICQFLVFILGFVHLKSLQLCVTGFPPTGRPRCKCK